MLEDSGPIWWLRGKHDNSIQEVPCPVHSRVTTCWMCSPIHRWRAIRWPCSSMPRAWSLGHAGVRQRAQPGGNGLRGSAAGRERLSDTYLHTEPRTAVRRPSDHRHGAPAGRPGVGGYRAAVDTEAPVGPLEVRFEGELARFTTAVPVEVGASSLGRAAAATLLGLEAPAIAGDPVQASCGLPFHLIPLDSEASLAKVMPDVGQWTLHVSPSGVDQVYLYVENGESLATRTFIREFAGLKEDPATGSAASALAGYLGTRDRLDDRQWRIRQGVDMGRPARSSPGPDATANRSGSRLPGKPVSSVRVLSTHGTELAVFSLRQRGAGFGLP